MFSAVNTISYDNQKKILEIIVMWNVPSKKRLSKIPLDQKLIYLHFLIGGSDWYIAEFDSEEIFLATSFLTAILNVPNGIIYHFLN